MKLITRFEAIAQFQPLIEILSKLEVNPDVYAAWLSGSFARGNHDLHSDVDLRIAIAPEHFDKASLPNEFATLEARAVVMQRRTFGENVGWHYLMLDNGTIYDILIYGNTEPFPETRQVLFAKSNWQLKLESGTDQAVTFPPVKPEAIKTLLEGFWLDWRKHAKIIVRGDMPILWLGERISRYQVMQLKYIAQTGLDCGSVDRFTIHTGTIVSRALNSWRVDQIPFLELANETAKLGQELAQKYDFEYPTRAEQAARKFL